MEDISVCFTSAGTFFNQLYSLSSATGNLNLRKDETRSIFESFTYDNLNRLIAYDGYGAQYDAKGNITDKSDVGHFSYITSGKPYAISRDSIYRNATPLRDQHVTYTSFMRPDTIQENGNLASFTYNSDGDRVRMRITNNGTLSLDRFYVGDGYEVDVNSSGTTERLYLGGDAYSAPAVYIKDASTGSWNVYYICRDYLGSITAITNSSGSLVQELSYDAWGRLRNPETLTAYTPGSEPALLLGRGYTGHEHLTMFGLINMNARLYDPALGRFLSPDPYVQAPDFSQSFNRYSYGLNNPLMYIDPSGCTLLSRGLNWTTEFLGKGMTTSEKLLAWTITLVPSGIDAIGNGDWSRLDPFYKGTISNNCYQITSGLFSGSPKQILSRFTWELPQTFIGFGYSQFLNYIGKINTVDHYGGATVLKGYGDYLPFTNTGLGVTLGSLIIGNNTIAADPNNKIFQHEYGHYLQSQAVGWAYLSGYALPSLWGDNDGYGHRYNPIEQDANARAIQYFYKKTNGNFIWHFDFSPIGYPGNDWDMMDYNTSGFQSLLKSLNVSPTWYDYAGWGFGICGPVFSGLYHSHYYRNNPIDQ